MKQATIVFAGTPEFSVPSLNALRQGNVHIQAVYCQPDRPAGRGRKQRPCAIKKRAQELGLNLRQPASLKSDEETLALAEMQPDLMVVVAYGLILPQSILEIPRLGCINIHASLLPRWRGAAPIQRAIEFGDRKSGICLMQMDRGLDTGAVLASREVSVGKTDTGGSLHDTLSTLGGKLLAENLDKLLAGNLPAVAQPDNGATYADKISKSDARVDWSLGATVIERRIRAFNPWPICWTRDHDKTIKIWAAETAVTSRETIPPAPGTVTSIGAGGIEIQCGRDRLRVLELQKPGGRRLSAAEFLNGTRIQPGHRFDSDTV